ncbi:MAG TPA: DUF6265 family protein [Vicinamibacterales bacterium]|nr:DUF6265 family protein [Vicinamibacterales bacterium]
MFVLNLLLLTIIPSLFQAAPSAKDVAWMSGCWDSTRNGRHVIEYWMPPEGGTLLGVSRTVANGKTTEWEFLMVREGDKGIEYVAKPSGQAEAVFVSTRVSPTEVVFENPTHDFPQRIIYKRDGDALIASIEGTRNGRLRRIDYPYTKATCGS